MGGQVTTLPVADVRRLFRLEQSANGAVALKLSCVVVRGPISKPNRRNRTPLTHTWIDIPDIPSTAGPDLPPRRCNGRRWPAYATARWAIWATMPHTARWGPSDWAYAVDSLELVVLTNREDAPVSLWTELRAREKAMGTTWDARQGMRIRYVTPGTEGPAASVASLDAYRDL
jgi:hypothetical protein